MKNLLQIGHSQRPHGIKGEFTFIIEEEFLEDLCKGSLIYIKGSSAKSSLDQKTEVYEIEKINFGHKIMAKLKGVGNRNQVEEMLPFGIYLEKSLLDELHQGEVLPQNYIGLRAMENETGKLLGVVENYYSNGAQLVLVIGGGPKDFEIPLVENFVKKIDMEKNEMIVMVPEII